MSPEAQATYRAEARAGAEVLAEYVDLRVPAAAAWKIGGGRVAWVNAAPEVLGDNLLADILAYLLVDPMTLERKTDARTLTFQAEQAMKSQPRERINQYRSIVLNPETHPSEGFRPDGGAYDIYFEGEGVLGFSMGYRRETRSGGSPVGLGRADAGLLAFTTAITNRSGEEVWTDSPGYTDWSGEGVVQSYTPGKDAPETWIYAPAGKALRAVGPGLFRATSNIPHHTLIDAGEARVLRAVQVQDGGIELQVDRAQDLAVRLQDEVLAKSSLIVRQPDPSGAMVIVPEHEAWYVDHAGILRLHAEKGVLYQVVFADREEEGAMALLSLDLFAGGRYGTVDGAQAVWLERYAFESTSARFIHWGAAPNGATLVLHGVTGDLYGAILPDVANPPARLVIEVNGAEAKTLDAPTPACSLDGDAGEWGDITVTLPKEALHRGLNVLRITNEGPNWFAFSSATVSIAGPK